MGSPVEERVARSATRIFTDFKVRTRKPDATSLGQVVVGNAGSGETHLIGTLRHEVWRNGGWFVLLDFAGIKDFWATAALCFVASLNQVMPDGKSQYQAILAKIVSKGTFDLCIRTVLENLIKQQDIAMPIDRETVMGLIKGFLAALDRAHPGEIASIKSTPSSAKQICGRKKAIVKERAKGRSFRSSSRWPEALWTCTIINIA